MQVPTENIGKVNGINGKLETFEFTLNLKEVKHIRRCLYLYDRIHPKLDEYVYHVDEELLKKFMMFGKRDRRSNGSESQLAFKLNTEAKCINCGGTKRLTIDHIIPLRDGGTHAQNNLQYLCVGCHVIKNYTEMLEVKKKEIQKYEERIKKIKEGGKVTPSELRHSDG